MRILVIVLSIATVLYGLFVLSLYLAGKRTHARAISGFIPDCIVFFKNLLLEKRVPRRYKVILIVLIGYLASPIDLIPDFIPVAGQLDDVIIVALAMRYILKGTGVELAEEHWPGPRSSLALLLKLARVK